jgi:hypothetical protein
MKKWTKTTYRHALNTQYEYYLQFPNPRGRHWLGQEGRSIVEFLIKLYGPAYEDIPNPEKNHWYLYIRKYNENWYIDHIRRRIYVKDGSTVTLFYLTYKPSDKSTHYV